MRCAALGRLRGEQYFEELRADRTLVEQALIASRKAVKEARSEILKLEEEAKREAKAAKAKQQTVRPVPLSWAVERSSRMSDSHTMNLARVQAAKFRKEGDKLGKH